MFCNFKRSNPRKNNDMRQYIFKQKVLALVLTIAALAVGQTAGATSTWTVTNADNVFTITRSESGTAETVKYRTVSLTALAGKNFVEATGKLTFAAGEASKTVTVTETAVSDIVAPYCYQARQWRRYRFEVLDGNGTELTHCDRLIEYGSAYQVEIEKFFKNVEIKAFGNEVTVDDVGYGQDYHAIDISKYFAATAPQKYFAAIGTQLGMTFDFQAKEIEDGYQYLQVLVDETTNYDSGNHDGEVGELHYAQLMAGFGHDPGVKNENYAYYSFPVGAADDINFGCHDMKWQRYKNTVGCLYTQRIKPGYQYNYQLNTRMLADANLQTLGVRFDASGKHDDKWKVKDFKAHIQAIDNCSPTLIEGDVKISAGPYNAGNQFYISVPFSEIMHVKNTNGVNILTINTSWGALTYEAGSGTNVITFKGTIANNLNTQTPLTITGLSGGPVRDMRGNPYKGTANIGVTFSGYTLNGKWGSNADADGTEAHPYIISSTAELDELATSVNGGDDFGPDAPHPDGYFFQLSENLTYTGSDNNYTAIGTIDNPFRGNFDGKGHFVKGIQILCTGDTDADNFKGLFGYVEGGTVKDVIVDEANIRANNYVAGVVGCCAGGTICGCLVINSKLAVNGGDKRGAIVGNNSATITANYYRNCTVSDSRTSNIGYYDIVDGLTDGAGAAEEVFIINPAANVNVSGATITYNSVPYFAKNAEVTLSYSGEVAAGYNVIQYVVTSPSGSTDSSGYGLVDGYTFQMPPVDMNASVNTSDPALALLNDDSARPAGKKNADYITAGGSGKKVILHGRRFYQDGEWNTICLPFNLALEGSFAGATLMELDVENKFKIQNAEFIIDANGEYQTGFDATTGTLYLFFKTATSITAGKPYIIKWGEQEGAAGYLGTAIDSPIFASVNISNADPAAVAFTGGSFKGTYTYTPFDAENKSILFLGAENTLYWPQSGASIGACRAYFQLSDPNGVREFKLNFGEESVTGVNEVIEVNASLGVNDNSWYSLDGRKLNGKPTQKGLYIVNGKKIIFK